MPNLRIGLLPCLALLICGANQANAQAIHTWSKNFDIGEVRKIVVDNDGNTYAASSVGGDYQVRKIDAAGNSIWNLGLNGGGTEIPSDIYLNRTTGELFVTGTSTVNGNADYFTAKYTTAGVYGWSVRYNGPANGNDTANDLTYFSGRVYVQGTSAGAGSGLDMATARYSSDGVEEWVFRYNGASNIDDHGRTVIVNNSGVYMGGCTDGSPNQANFLTVKFSNSTLAMVWEKTFATTAVDLADPQYMTADVAGNIYICFAMFAPATGRNIVTVKYNSAGANQWIRTFSTNGQDTPCGIGVAPLSQNVYVGGTVVAAGVSDLVFIRYNADGSLAWANQYDVGASNTVDKGLTAELNSKECLYIAGTRGNNALVVKRDSGGNQVWYEEYTNGSSDKKEAAVTMVSHPAGGVIVAGFDSFTTGNTKRTWVARFDNLLTAVSTDPNSVPGGKPTTGTVTFGFPNFESSVVQLSSSLPAVVQVPDQINLPAGTYTATFAIQTVPVTADTNVTIKASFQNHDVTTTLVVRRARIYLIEGSGEVIGGDRVQLNLVLDGVAAADITLGMDTVNHWILPDGPYYVRAGQSQVSVELYSTPSDDDEIDAMVVHSNPGQASKGFQIRTAKLFNILAPATVIGGASVPALIQLIGITTAQGKVISLSSSNTQALATPASMTISGGHADGTATLTTSPVTADVDVTVTATLAGISKTDVVRVLRAVLQQFTLDSASITSGQSTIGRVTLSGPAPTAGYTIGITDNSSAVATPGSVYIGSGATQGAFDIGTTPVSVLATRTITASLNTTTITKSLTLKPNLVSLTAPASIVGGNDFGATTTLYDNAPTGGTTVSLSDNSAVTTTPGSTTVPAGSKTSTVTVTTTGVAAITTATLTATVDGIAKSASIQITPAQLSTLTLNPTSVKGGTSTSGAINLNGRAPTGGIVVTLADSSSSINTPASATVLAGNRSVGFTATSSPVTATYVRSITASYNGVSRTASLTLTP